MREGKTQRHFCFCLVNKHFFSNIKTSAKVIPPFPRRRRQHYIKLREKVALYICINVYIFFFIHISPLAPKKITDAHPPRSLARTLSKCMLMYTYICGPVKEFLINDITLIFFLLLSLPLRSRSLRFLFEKKKKPKNFSAYFSLPGTLPLPPVFGNITAE